MKSHMDLRRIGDEVDQLITIDIGARGVVNPLYDAALEIASTPLSLGAATKLKEAIKCGDNVLIATGFPIPPDFIQETDGPLGAAALARTVSFGFKAVPILLTEETAMPVLESSCRAMELNVLDSDQARLTERSTSVLPFPIDDGQAKERSKEILDLFHPTALIVVEKVGMNSKGVYHNARGICVSSASARIEYLVDAVKAKGALTVGIGDGGNEVGMGTIRESVMTHVPYAKKCQCSCGAGITASSKVDFLVVASVSNWGAYGIEACASAILGSPEIMHNGEVERRSIRACVAAGGIDGMSGTHTPKVDGITESINAHIVDILATLASS